MLQRLKTMIYKTLHNKQKIEQHGSHSKQGDWRTKRDEDQRYHNEFVRKVIALYNTYYFKIEIGNVKSGLFITLH
jgi:hypothetical protein